MRVKHELDYILEHENWVGDEYWRGRADGLIQALAAMDEEKPKFIVL